MRRPAGCRDPVPLPKTFLPACTPVETVLRARLSSISFRSRSVDCPEAVLERLGVVVDGVHELLLRKLPRLGLNVELPLHHGHFPQHLRLEDFVCFVTCLCCGPELVLHLDQLPVAVDALLSDLLLDPEGLVADALEELRFPLQPGHLFDFKFLHVCVKLLEHVLVVALDLALPVLALFVHSYLKLANLAVQLDDLRLKHLCVLLNLSFEVSLHHVKLLFELHLDRFGGLDAPPRLYLDELL
mmetsp:Transcript_12717/g.37341  ORF Transcript_12717/g.37341 Transcript_12717/m.37341 type:complete len:242 (-) Transcript_12717:206-931(-)